MTQPWPNGPDGPYLTAVRKFIGGDMAATIKRADIKKDAAGKTVLEVPDTTPKHFKVAKRNKAKRKAAGLVKNRDAKR